MVVGVGRVSACAATGCSGAGKHAARSPVGADSAPEQRDPPATFQVGDNVLGEGRGPIDSLSYYNIELVIDLDESGDLSGADFVCRYKQERAPDAGTWKFKADLSRCDSPAGFDLETFEP